MAVPAGSSCLTGHSKSKSETRLNTPIGVPQGSRHSSLQFPQSPLSNSSPTVSLAAGVCLILSSPLPHPGHPHLSSLPSLRGRLKAAAVRFRGARRGAPGRGGCGEIAHHRHTATPPASRHFRSSATLMGTKVGGGLP